MTRWSAITRTRRSRSALAYGSRSTAAAKKTSTRSYTTSRDATVAGESTGDETCPRWHSRTVGSSLVPSHGQSCRVVRLDEPRSRNGRAGDPHRVSEKVEIDHGRRSRPGQPGLFYREPASLLRFERRGAWRSLVSALVWGTRGPE